MVFCSTTVHGGQGSSSSGVCWDCGSERLNHPLYSSDGAPGDVCPFPRVVSHTFAERFPEDEVKEITDCQLQHHYPEVYVADIKRLERSVKRVC